MINVKMLRQIIILLLLKTVATKAVLLDQLLGCTTQFVTLDYKIAQNYSETAIDVEVCNRQTPYTIESINSNLESDMKVFSSSNPTTTPTPYFLNVKFVLCSAFVYFADPIAQYTDETVFTIFQDTQIIPYSSNPTFFAVFTNDSSGMISVPEQDVDITSIYLFSYMNIWYMYCIPCAKIFHPIYETDVNLLGMWESVHKLTDSIPLQSLLLLKWDGKNHEQECPNWERT